jgi:hypothetical protein
MSAFTELEKRKIIAVILQYEPYKDKEITKELVKEISDKLDKTLIKISELIEDDYIPADLPDNMFG